MDTPTPPSFDPSPPQPTGRVEFLSPLAPAWERMRRMLFPFDLRTWCTVGFGCFLAKLVEGGFGGGGGGGSWNLDDSNAAAETARSWADPSRLDVGGLAESTAAGLARFLGLQIDDSWTGAMVVTLLVTAVVLALALLVALVYLSARGHFVFVDNVALERAAFWAPWREYRREGHSLFLWRLGYIGVTIGAFLLVICLPIAVGISLQDDLAPSLGIPLLMAWIVLLFLPLILITMYIDLWLTEFVVPLMYRHRLTTTAAWKKFLPLLRRHAFDFLAWGLLIFLLHVLVGMAVVAAGIATCCIGLLLVLIPYVGTVLLLPLHLTYRGYSLEFFAQYGDEWWSFPPPWEPATPPTPVDTPPDTPTETASGDTAGSEPPEPPTTPS